MSRPVARVALDVSLAHLDRPFDYLVPESMSDAAVPGCRLRLRFAGQRVGGFLLDRVERSDHPGRLGWIERVVSSEVVLRGDVARLCRAVADRYAGTFADVVRLAVPTRHARTERAPVAPADTAALPDLDLAAWEPYPGGRALVDRIAGGQAPRACWSALPGDWAAPLGQVVVAAARAGRGVLVCLPDARDVSRLDAALCRLLGPGRHVVLSADLGPQARYRAFLALSRDHVRIVLGTRGAAFAPVHALGLVAMWDDGNDAYAEPRAPYPHAREVLVRRAQACGAALLLAGHARSVEAQALVESRWCADLSAPVVLRRAHGPRVSVAGGAGDSDDPGAGTARLPAAAMRAIRAGLGSGPVLVSVPRRGYRTALACQLCRQPALCSRCGGPLRQLVAGALPTCRRCGLVHTAWSCPRCGSDRLRAPVVGEQRTADELGRAFPGAAVRTSSAPHVVDRVDDRPALVLATPGAEPDAAGGYAAGVLLDTDLMLARPELRSAEESVRRWFNVVALVRRNGVVVASGDPTEAALQALVRADPVGFASRELAERRAARLPPAVRLAVLDGPTPDVMALRGLAWPEPADLVGPAPLDAERSRLVVRVPRGVGPQLSRRLQVLQSERSARKLVPLRVHVDPVGIS